MKHITRRLILIVGLIMSLMLGASATITPSQAQQIVPPLAESAIKLRQRAETERDMHAMLSAQTELSANVNLDQGIIVGRAANSNAVEITVDVNSQRYIYKVIPYFDGVGYMYVGALNCSNVTCPLDEGNSIMVAQGVESIKLDIPVLTAIASGATKEISGTTKANSAIRVFHRATANADMQIFDIMSHENGTYKVNASARREGSGYVMLTLADNAFVTRQYVVPFLRVYVNDTVVSGATGLFGGTTSPYPFGPVFARDPITHQWSVHIFDGYANESSGFFATLGGRRLIPGTEVKTNLAVGEVSAIVPSLTVKADETNGMLSGFTSPDTDIFLVQFQKPIDMNRSYLLSATDLITPITRSKADGTYSIAMKFQPGDFGAVAIDLADGNQALAMYSTTHLNIQLPDPFVPLYSFYTSNVLGQWSTPNETLSIGVRGARGWLKDLQKVSVRGDGFYTLSSLLNVEQGDILEIQDLTGKKITQAIPALDLEQPILNRKISGTTTPNAQVTIQIQKTVNDVQSSSVTLKTLSTETTANGAFVVTIPDSILDSEITSITISVVASPQLNISRSVTFSTNVCRDSIMKININANLIMLFPHPPCSYDKILVKRGAQQFELPAYWGGAFPWTEQGVPQIFKSGDVIELLAGKSVLSRAVVPPLTLSLKTGSQRVTGVTLPDTAVTVSAEQVLPSAPTLLSLPDMSLGVNSGVTVQSDAQGRYTATLPITIEAGVRVHAEIKPEGTLYVTDATIPNILVNSSYVSYPLNLLIQPNEFYTITVEFLDFNGVTQSQDLSGYASELGDVNLYPTYAYAFLNPPITLTLQTPSFVHELHIQSHSSARRDWVANKIVGKTLPNSNIAAWLPTYLSDAKNYLYVMKFAKSKADSQGYFEIDLAKAEEAGVQLDQTNYNQRQNTTIVSTDLEGNAISFGVAIPGLKIGDYGDGGKVIMGTAPQTEPFELTLKKPTSPTAQVLLTGTGSVGEFYFVINEILHTGDVLELVQSDSRITYTYQEINAQYSQATKILGGKTLPGIVVSVFISTLRSGPNTFYRSTVADPSGNFAIDLSDLADSLQWVSLSINDERNNYSIHSFNANRTYILLPLVSQ
jgi:hypothetical protein